MKNDRARETRKKSITVGFLYEQTHERFKLKQLNGENAFDNQIKDRNLNRPGYLSFRYCTSSSKAGTF